MSFTLAKRRINDVSLSNERGHKRSKVVMETEANGVEREEEEEVSWNCGLPTLSFEHSSTAITPSPSNFSSDTVIKYLQREDKEEKEEMYVWARYFFDDFTQNCDVSGSSVIPVYELMLEHCGNEPVPPEDIITKWMDEKHSDEHCSMEISDTSEGGHSSTAMGDSSFNKPTETTMLDDDCKDKDFSLHVENSDCAVASTEMIVESSKPQHRSHKFVWARCYFDKLMEEEGRISLSNTEIRNLMQQNCGNKSVPSSACVTKWLCAKRMEVGEVGKCRKNFAWARCYFDKLMEEEGRIDLTDTEVHNLMKKNCGNESLPGLTCVRTWLWVKRKELGEVGKRYESKKLAWARCYFDKLMEEEGRIDLTKTEIHNLMQQNCGNKSVPSLACVSRWQSVKRKEVGKRNKSKKFAWARCYFDKLMEEEGRIDLSNTEIHNLMQQNCGNKSVPSLGCLGTWLWVKRKEVGNVGKKS